MVQKKLPLINSAHGSDTRNIINELIKLFNGMGYTYNEALQKAHDVLNEAQQTNNMNQDVQNQINNLILSDGESDAEVVQARIDAEGNEYDVLKTRLDEKEQNFSSQLAETANQLPHFVTKKIFSQNLFNKETITPNHHVTSNGSILESEVNFVSDFIAVEPDTNYTKSTAHFIAFYDGKREFIGAATGDVVRTPVNAEYARLTAQHSSLDSYMFVEGDSLPQDYDPYVSLVPKEDVEFSAFNANNFGADPSASWTTNRNAFQAANDAAYESGGGRVIAEPGVYEVKGIIQDSRVSFDLPGVTLKSPDGLQPGIISGRVYETTGSINKGSKTLTVDNIYGIEKGSIISVGRADGMIDTQFTKLSSSINSTQTTGINIDVVTRFPGTGYMRVGDELIGYTGISGNALTGVSRGALNTTASAHSSGAFIGVARSLLAEVIDINGSTLTLNKPADISVSNTIVQTGVVFPGVNITKIDGNRVSGGAPGSWYGLEYSFARWGSIGDLVSINGDMGAIILDRGTSDFNIRNLNIRDTGIYDATSGARGSGLWIFRGSKRNRINSLTVEGKAWSGFYIDDRTATGSEWDSPCDYNIISAIYLELEYIVDGFKTGGLIIGSNYNKVLNGVVIGRNPNGVTGQLGGGIEVAGGGQFVTGDGSEPQATGNEIGNINFDVSTPWRLLSPGNILHDCTYSENATAVPPVVEGNFVYASTNTPGGMPVTESKFTDGRQNDPSITFINDDDTGFYRYMEDTVGLSLGGTNKVTWYQAEMRLSDGYRVTTGTNLGTVFGLTPSQKLGFFGTTPKVQQSAIPRNNGRDLGDVEDRLNLVIDTLRELGFIAPN